MAISFPVSKTAPGNKRSRKKRYLTAALVVALAAGFLLAGCSGGGSAGTGSGDLKILKSEVTDTVKFYPYRAGKVNMEILAVRASDGTVRTAFNTCQVCFDSGRGYYRQEGTELVCQNCGNRFGFDQVEVEMGGCNPVPILKENKTEDDTYITISQGFLEENKGLFAKWRK